MSMGIDDLKSCEYNSGPSAMPQTLREAVAAASYHGVLQRLNRWDLAHIRAGTVKLMQLWHVMCTEITSLQNHALQQVDCHTIDTA